MSDVKKLEQDIRNGYRMDYDHSMRIARETPLDELCALAGRLRTHFLGNSFDLCSIMNARSGLCSEDCKWCSQSRFHNTNVDIYPLAGPEEALGEALHNDGKGVHRFSLVTSGRTMTDGEIDKVCNIYHYIGANTGIKLCASMGLLDGGQLRRLFDSGVTRYHCNLETAPSYFDKLCTTHTVQQKIETIRAAKQVGMEVCSGGIIGMGEEIGHRIELAIALRGLEVDSIPLNILNPIKGTQFEGMASLPDEDVLRTVAMFRIIYPAIHIRLAGGRNIIKHLVPRLLECGVSALITGDMLTTTGSEIDDDKKLLKNKGFKI